jgi:transglutaminase-like putative cysteine protease
MTDAPVKPPRPAITATVVVDVLIVLVLSGIGIVGFATAFDDVGWIVASVSGLLVGVVAAILSHFLRIGAVPTFLLAVILYFLFGSAAAVPELALFGFVPTLESLVSLSVGTVYSWADILTLRPPVELPDYVTAAPYFATWAVGLVATVLAVRWLPLRRRTAWRMALVLIGPFVLYLAGVLLGTDEPVFAAVRGISFGALALAWLGWRRGSTDTATVSGGSSLLLRKIAGSSAVVAAGVAVGIFGGSAIAPPPSDRFVLREVVTPPFEPLEYPSPFTAYRKYTKLLEEVPLFSVEGMRPGDRIRLATLDTYDGVSWGVAGSQLATDGSGSFSLVGSTIPEPGLVTPADDEVELTVTIVEYADVWMPSIGYPTSIDFDGPDARDQLATLRYNPATGTAVLANGLAEGDEYQIEAVRQRLYQTDELISVPTASFSLPPVSVIPDIVTSKAQEFAGSAESPIERLRAIEAVLQTTGYLSHGAADDAVASRAGQGADRIIELFTRNHLVGDEEQYATAFALMARSMNYPARVVMGFAPELRDGQQNVLVMGKDVTAWVEVAFEGVGWIPFYPTPDDTDIPQDQTPKPQSEPQPQVRQPPRTENDENDLVAGVEVDDSSDEPDLPFEVPGWVIAIGLALLIPAAIVFVPMLVIAAIKGRRMQRRRRGPTHRAAAGAWDELVDRLAELGYRVPKNLTRLRTATALTEQAPEGALDLRGLAQRTDEVVFSGVDVPPASTDMVWTEALAAVDAARAALTRGQRFISRYRVRALQSWATAVAARASSTQQPAQLDESRK